MILDFLIHNLIKENPPELNKKKCINSIMKSMECDICKQTCPEQAVMINNRYVSFDEKLCTSCGMCKVKCPTQAIKVKETGEEDIFVNAGEKENLVFACSLEEAIGNLKISCLNSLHPEFISSLFILHKEKKLHFNLSKCSKCEFGYENTLFKDNLNKAVKFVNALGIETVYEIHTEEKELQNLITESISRRNLFKLVQKESGNIVLKTINTIIDSDDNQLSVRKALLEALKSVTFKEENESAHIFWEYWDVNINCDGCGKCESICPGKAWKIDKNDSTIKLYHNFGNCYKCGLCEKVCPKKALTKGNIRNFALLEYNLKKEINLNTCSICNKKYIPENKEDTKCDICKKKELLRRKISTSI